MVQSKSSQPKQPKKPEKTEEDISDVLDISHLSGEHQGIIETFFKISEAREEENKKEISFLLTMLAIEAVVLVITTIVEVLKPLGLIVAVIVCFVCVYFWGIDSEYQKICKVIDKMVSGKMKKLEEACNEYHKKNEPKTEKKGKKNV